MFKKYDTPDGARVGMTYRMSDLQPEVLPRPRQAGALVEAGTVSGFGLGTVMDHVFDEPSGCWDMAVRCEDGSEYTLREKPSPIMFFENNTKPVGLPAFAPMDPAFPEKYIKSKRCITRWELVWCVFGVNEISIRVHGERQN